MTPDLTPSLPLYATLFAQTTLLRLATYVGFAAPAFLVFWVWWRDAWQHRRIVDRFPPARQLWAEVYHSLVTLLIFGGLGLLLLYCAYRGWTVVDFGPDRRGAGYWLASLAAFIVLHDTYFYWVHRLMHDPRLFRRLHATHHRSANPSPWAIFSFQPSEAVVQFGVSFVFAFCVPAHYTVYLAWSVWLLAWNVLGHLGYELFPSSWTRLPGLRLVNTATHHAMHHRYVTCNFGLYFTVWDRLMGTEHPRYEETFQGVRAGTRKL